MRVLVLGGTRFIGRHTVTTFLSEGHEVTLVHRGQSLSPFGRSVRTVTSDRRRPTSELVSVLASRWDAVVDFCAHDTADVASTTPLLGSVRTYVLMSTCGLYRRVPQRLDEAALLLHSDDPDPARASAIRKLACERFLSRHAARRVKRLVTIRLGVTIGPHDPTGRLAYWLERAAAPGGFLVPMAPDQPLQLVDARDVAAFIAGVIGDADVPEVLNVAGVPTVARELIAAIRAAGAMATPSWVDEVVALRWGLRPWVDVPFWLPVTTAERHLMNVDSSAACRRGLSRRPLVDTVADCLSTA